MTQNGSTPRLLFFLPNIFTGLNIACGVAAIIFSQNQQFHTACILLLLGAVFDSVDGRLARLTGTESTFGEQFDSMSDMVSFGVAPALVIYQRFFLHLGRPGMALAFLFTLCGAMRLARFNANIDRVSSDYFQGLAIPLGALGMVGLTLFSLEVPEILNYSSLIVAYVMLYSFLMVSNIPFPSFKKSPWVKEHTKQVLFIIFSLAALIWSCLEYTIFIMVIIYVVSSTGYYIVNYSRMKNMFKVN